MSEARRKREAKRKSAKAMAEAKRILRAKKRENPVDEKAPFRCVG